MHHTGLQQIHVLVQDQSNSNALHQDGISACAFLLRSWTAVAVAVIAECPPSASVCYLSV